MYCITISHLFEWLHASSRTGLNCVYTYSDYTIRRTVGEVREEGVLRRIPTQPMGYEDGKEFLLLLNDIPDSTTDTLVGWKGSIEGVKYRLGGQLQGGR